MMKGMVLGLLAETALHPGSGQTGGAVDLPVSREAKTGYPVIYGSGMKGALRDKWRRAHGENSAQEEEIFGKPDTAGGLAVTDARLLLLPVRSLNGHFKLATCPYLLRRFKRDLALVGLSNSTCWEVPIPGEGQAIIAVREEDKREEQRKLYLEEFVYEAERQDLDAMIKIISKLIKHDEVKQYLKEQLVILSDDDFGYFTQYGLPVVARNKLDDNTKTSKNLWYEEQLPADTLLYTMVLARTGKDKAMDKLREFLKGSPYVQVGGNETVGQGWCIVEIFDGQGGATA